LLAPVSMSHKSFSTAVPIAKALLDKELR